MATTPSDGFSPSDDARRLANEMATADELQEKILLRGIEKGTEAGVSVCGSKERAKDAKDATYSGVVLPGCPLDKRGLMHGAGGHDLHAPRHSLLDMSNVLFGLGSASMVVGAEQSDILLAPNTSQVEDAQAIFQNALGIEVESPDDVIEAFKSGRIRDADTARRRIRGELGPLFQSVETRHEEALATAQMSQPTIDATLASTALKRSRESAVNINEIVHDPLTKPFRFDIEDVDINLAELIFSQFADALVLMAFLAFLGGRPSTLIAGSAT